MPGYGRRVRTPVGHRYLEVLQLQATMDTGGVGSTALAITPRHEQQEEEEERGLNLLILGMTSGTAMDEVDFALCRFTQADPEATLHLDIIQVDSVGMPSKVRTDIVEMLQQDAISPNMLSQMDVELGYTFTNAIHAFAKRHGIAVDDIDLVGSGGQLVSLTGTPPKGQHRTNVCLGEAAMISAKTGITTVSDFRTTEQAVGRQGAPLFSYLVGLLLHHPTRLQICITVGSISTACFIPSGASGGIDAMYDWDTGPGTVLIEAAMRFYGLDPLHVLVALQGGTVCQPIIDQILNSNGYLKLRPPKTPEHEIFDDKMAQEMILACQKCGCSRADTIATITRLTTAAITQQLLLFGPGKAAINNADIILDGRGSHNPLFLSDLRSSFPGASFSSMEDKTGIPAKATKAVGFAMQAMETILGRALPVAANADVRRPNTITGKIAPGVNWRGLQQRSVGFGGGGKERGWEGLPEVRELMVLKRDRERYGGGKSKIERGRECENVS